MILGVFFNLEECEVTVLVWWCLMSNEINMVWVNRTVHSLIYWFSNILGAGIGYGDLLVKYRT